MERRYKIFAKEGVRNFDSFNNRTRPETDPELSTEIEEAEDESAEEEIVDEDEA